MIDDPPFIQLFGSGEETRDFMFVEDAVELISVCGTAASCEPFVVNGGTGLAIRVRDLASAVARALGRRTEVRFTGSPEREIPSIIAPILGERTLWGFAATGLSNGASPLGPIGLLATPLLSAGEREFHPESRW